MNPIVVAETSVMMWVVIVVCGVLGILAVIAGILLIIGKPPLEYHRRKCSGIYDDDPPKPEDEWEAH